MALIKDNIRYRNAWYRNAWYRDAWWGGRL